MTCSTCHASNLTAAITSSIVIGRRRITWTQCRPCWAAEERMHA
jgi:hypothetical protein